VKRESIIAAIEKERERQNLLHPEELGDQQMLAVLIEEIGEVGKALLEEGPEELEKELIQAAAVCFRWLENRTK
jgi:NTP pyrophosphatase (non-canonical NTP hydrolase)